MQALDYEQQGSNSIPPSSIHSIKFLLFPTNRVRDVARKKEPHENVTLIRKNIFGGTVTSMYCKMTISLSLHHL